MSNWLCCRLLAKHSPKLQTCSLRGSRLSWDAMQIVVVSCVYLLFQMFDSSISSIFPSFSQRQWIIVVVIFGFCRARSCALVVFVSLVRASSVVMAEKKEKKKPHTTPKNRVLINRLVQIICKLTVFPFCFYYKIDDVNKNIWIPVRFSWDATCGSVVHATSLKYWCTCTFICRIYYANVCANHHLQHNADRDNLTK